MEYARKSCLEDVIEKLDEAINLIAEQIEEEQNEREEEDLIEAFFSSREDDLDEWITDMEGIISDIEDIKSYIDAIML